MDPALRSMTGDCTFWIWGVHPNSWRGCLGRDPWSLSCPNCVIGFDHTIYVYRYIYSRYIYIMYICVCILQSGSLICGIYYGDVKTSKNDVL